MDEKIEITSKTDHAINTVATAGGMIVGAMAGIGYYAIVPPCKTPVGEAFRRAGAGMVAYTATVVAGTAIGTALTYAKEKIGK